MDNASNDIGSEASRMLISPEGHKIHCAICFGFKASNNEAEYEAHDLECRSKEERKKATF